MNGTRLLGVVCATILASSLSTSLIACSASNNEEKVTTAKATSAASVSIALLDDSGNKVGTASGVLIAPRLVLTAGHAISGKGKWEITSADGKTKVFGSRGMTYDWMKYDSTLAHPRRHDVGVIHLDAPIKLDTYPRLVGSKPVDGLDAFRVRNNGATFEHIGVGLNKLPTAPTSLLGTMKGGETLDTGGAVYNDEGIIGVVSGRGLTTGKLYVARTDQLGAWLSAKVGCAGGTSKTFAEGQVDKSKVVCDENGNPIPGANPGSNGGDNNSSSNNSSSSNGDSGGSCEDNNDGVCSGNCGGTNPAQPQGGPNGNNDSANGGAGANGAGGESGSGATSSGSSGTNPNKDGNGGDDGNTGSAANGSGGPGSTGDGSATGGSSGANPSKTGSGTNGTGGGAGGESGSGSAGTSNHSGGSHASHDDGESCQGESDNPETCPPEADGCYGPKCGGGHPDKNIDFGNCGCGGSGHGSSENDIDVR